MTACWPARLRRGGRALPFRTGVSATPSTGRARDQPTLRLIRALSARGADDHVFRQSPRQARIFSTRPRWATGRGFCTGANPRDDGDVLRDRETGATASTATAEPSFSPSGRPGDGDRREPWHTVDAARPNGCCSFSGALSFARALQLAAPAPMRAWCRCVRHGIPGGLGMAIATGTAIALGVAAGTAAAARWRSRNKRRRARRSHEVADRRGQLRRRYAGEANADAAFQKEQAAADRQRGDAARQHAISPAPRRRARRAAGRDVAQRAELARGARHPGARRSVSSQWAPVPRPPRRRHSECD